MNMTKPLTDTFLTDTFLTDTFLTDTFPTFPGERRGWQSVVTGAGSVILFVIDDIAYDCHRSNSPGGHSYSPRPHCRGLRCPPPGSPLEALTNV